MAKGTANAQTGRIAVRQTYSTNHDPKPGDHATTKAQARAVVKKQAAAGKHAGRGGGGGRRGDPLQRMAQSQVSAAEAPIEAQIKAEKAANLQKARAQMGFSKAAAAIMQSAAPAIGDAYTGAANAEAGYSRGLGSGVQAQLDQNQQQDNQFLQQMGTPQGALHSAAPVGDMSYGLQGYIPATSLQREGAAWESAAQLAPGNELHAGQQLAQSTLANDPTLATLQGELGKIAATEPDVYNKLVGLQQGQQRINLTAQRDQVLAQQGQERIQLSAASLQQRIRQAAISNAQSWARIGISQKSLKLRAAAAQAKLNASKSGGTGGFTPNELVTIKGKAASMAQALHDGVPATSTKAALPPKNYKAALAYLVNRGIPPTIAISELKGAGYKVPKGAESAAAKIGGMLSGGFYGSVGAAAKVVSLAHEYLGTPYVWGGSTPKGFDCSGFLQFLYGKIGVSIPRTTYDQWKTGRAVGKNQLQPGDAVFFRGGDSRGGLPGHVGIYIGDGMMIDAPHTGSSVRVESVWNFGGYMGARRFGKA